MFCGNAWAAVPRNSRGRGRCVVFVSPRWDGAGMKCVDYFYTLWWCYEFDGEKKGGTTAEGKNSVESRRMDHLSTLWNTIVSPTYASRWKIELARAHSSVSCCWGLLYFFLNCILLLGRCPAETATGWKWNPMGVPWKNGSWMGGVGAGYSMNRSIDRSVWWTKWTQ